MVSKWTRTCQPHHVIMLSNSSCVFFRADRLFASHTLRMTNDDGEGVWRLFAGYTLWRFWGQPGLDGGRARGASQKSGGRWLLPRSSTEVPGTAPGRPRTHLPGVRGRGAWWCWGPICDDFETEVVCARPWAEVEVKHDGVTRDAGASFTAHSGVYVFGGRPSASEWLVRHSLGDQSLDHFGTTLRLTAATFEII